MSERDMCSLGPANCCHVEIRTQCPKFSRETRHLAFSVNSPNFEILILKYTNQFETLKMSMWAKQTSLWNRSSLLVSSLAPLVYKVKG